MIAEPGRANSGFFHSFKSQFHPSKHYLLDLNAKGLNKFSEQNPEERVAQCVLADILNDVGVLKGKSDLVFSVGLVEHFSRADTTKAVARHFEIAKPGALVLLTFPTPVFVYRVIRGSLQLGNMWKFPDERPLEFQEVRAAIAPHGDILEERTNRAIGLAHHRPKARLTAMSAIQEFQTDTFQSRTEIWIVRSIQVAPLLVVSLVAFAQTFTHGSYEGIADGMRYLASGHSLISEGHGYNNPIRYDQLPTSSFPDKPYPTPATWFSWSSAASWYTLGHLRIFQQSFG